MNRSCIQCSTPLDGRYKRKFCGNSCQGTFQYLEYIDAWKRGLKNGLRGKTTFNLSAHIVRYIKDKFKNKCAQCGWNEINPHTNRSPLEIEHIDGNYQNNHESNLTLLCPNCHSLTKTYKNGNLGHGRLWRKEKYVKIGNVPL